MPEPINRNRALHLLERDRDCGTRTAIVYGATRISFAELADEVRRTAGALQSLGIDRGRHVGVLVPSEPAFIIVQQALFLLGATVSPLNIYYRPGELAHAIASCALDAVVLHADLRDRLPLSVRAEAGSLRLAIVTGAHDPGPGFASLDAALASAEPLATPAQVSEREIALLLNTSATTGKSKGVMLTAGNLAANYDATPGWLGLTREDVILCALPLYNTFGLNQCINAMLVTGATLVLLPRFDAERCIQAIQRHGCTFMPAVPTMLQKMIDHPGLHEGALHSLRRIMTGGAPVPVALLHRVMAATSPDTILLTGYGLTEGAALITLCQVRCGADGELDHGKTIGRVLDGMDLEVMADDGTVLPRGSVGEFVVRGPNIMAGYFNAPDDTAQALRDGWLHTGDVGLIAPDGNAYIVDRKKDVIIRGGQNIYPADIEEVIYGIEGVSEVAVVAQEDDVLGEVPVAFVATRPGMTVEAEQVIARCADQLASYKRPSAVHFLEELPKGPTGKILRRGLRELLAVPFTG
ncbi:class I adenylate-forming enzyme family protein [Novosphingobium piscinae]|uniref:3-methylmercaptopropionyl-CoA ligase n=1 Tax=Novosphingobium piscinae TaxID=1507448 RepID=A0A7X1G0V2_9SPHN|nr:AMP-binding protein [Novosphingobium piscinae]MBC2670595.1 AMP-binding protein [Novosphingobium piscinae]